MKTAKMSSQGAKMGPKPQDGPQERPDEPSERQDGCQDGPPKPKVVVQERQDEILIAQVPIYHFLDPRDPKAFHAAQQREPQQSAHDRWAT